MIGLRGLTALALACAASAMAACSSSSDSGGSPTKFACAANNPMAQSSSDMACTSCSESNCGAQFSAAFGSGYASGNFGGGSCASYVNCLAACPCNDVNCALGCAPSSACQTDLGAESMCTDQKCASQCGGGIGGGDDGGGTVIDTDGGTGGTGGSTGACDESAAAGVCLATGLPAADCTQAGGTTVTSCPTADLVGCCTMSGIKTCFYSQSGLTTAQAMQACGSGTFSTTL